MSAQTVTLRSPIGEAIDVPRDEVAAYLNRGFVPETTGARVERLGEEARAEKYGTLGGQILAGTAGVARGATLGGSDIVAGLFGSEGDVEALREARKYNPGTSLATEILGGAVPSLLSGGTGALGTAARLTPTGAVSSAATGLTGRIAGAEGAGVARYIGGTAAGSAAEGAISNVGSYISDVALGDKKLSAEGFLASAGQGALWGGAAGGALAGVERGTIAARRLFPRHVANDREAVQLIEDNFLAKADDVIKQGDELEKAARSAVDDLRLRSAELNLEREKLRGAKDTASRVRMKEIDVEKARIAAQRKAMRDAKNAERAAAGLPDLPPEVQAPTLPPLDEASVVPTGPPANDVGAAPLDMSDPLIAQLAGTQQQLDQGIAFRDIAQSEVDDLSIAASNTAHEAGMLADDAADGSIDAAERLAQKTEDYAARKQAVRDWIAKYKPGARNQYSASLTGDALGAGGGPVRTDRTRMLPEGGVDFEAQAGDRVFAGIGEARDVVTEPLASPAAARLSPPTIDVPAESLAEADGVLKGMGIDRGSRDLMGSFQTPEGTELRFSSARDVSEGGTREVAMQGDILVGGEKVGELKRTLARDSRGKLHAHHESLRLDKPYRGKGIADAINRSSIQSYMDMGVDKVTLAASEVGRYHWPKMGWKYDDPDEIADAFVRWAKKQPELSGRAPDELRDMSMRAMDEPGGLANLDIDGMSFKTPIYETTEEAGSKLTGHDDFRAGKAFLLSSSSPQGVTMSLRLDPSDKHFQLAAKKLGLEAPTPAAPAARRSGADLDSAYDDLIERASNAADRSELAAIAKEAGAIEEEILERVASRGGKDAEQVAKIRAKRAEYNWTADDVAARRAEKLAIAKTNDPVTPSAKMRAEQRDLDAYERVVRANQGRADMAHSYPKKVDLAEEILSQGEQAAGGAAQAPAAPNRDMGRFIADADEAIRVVGDFERAQYELAKELGPSAPPSIASQAAEYEAALDNQARKSTETLAAQADQIAKSTAAPSAADPGKAMALMSLPKAPAVPVDATKKAAGRLADVAGMLELLNTFGDIPGMPSASDLPVVGPMLAMYLRVRGATAAYRRMGGRIGASAEAKVAVKSAEIRDKAAGIADALLEGAGKAAKRARGPATVGGTKLLDTLKHSLYPDGQDRDEQKTAAAAAKARIEELSRAAADPDGVRAAVRRQLGSQDPDLSAAVEDATLRKLQYLQKHAPKMPPPGPLGTKPWQPSTGEIERFARRVRAAEDPLTVLQDVERGTVTVEAAEALREVYPALFSEVQMRLLSRAAELEAKLPYQRVISLSLLFDAPLDDSLRPQNLVVLQSAHASSAQAGPGTSAAGPQQAQPPAPSVAGPVQLSRLYETPEIRRASRR